VLGGAWLVRGRFAVAVQAPATTTTTPVKEALKDDAEPESLCPREAGKVSRQYGSFHVRVERNADDMCRYEIRLANGQHSAPRRRSRPSE